MQGLLLELLLGLEQIGDQHDELFDTVVRERLGEAVMEGFVRAIGDYKVRPDFGMCSPEVDAAVRALVVSFIDAAKELSEQNQIVTFHGRLAAFQDEAVLTPFGNDYDEFFGHTPPEDYNDDGEVQWDRVR